MCFRNGGAISRGAISTVAAPIESLGCLVPVNLLTISVLSISLWVKRLCHHQVVALKRCMRVDEEVGGG